MCRHRAGIASDGQIDYLHCALPRISLVASRQESVLMCQAKEGDVGHRGNCAQTNKMRAD
jgi:hypothetical protein